MQHKMNHRHKSLHVNYYSKQTKVVFTFSVTHRSTSCIFDLQEMYGVHFLLKIFSKSIFKIFANLHCLHQCLQAGSVLLHCLCWCMLYLGTLPPPVNRWNSVKPLAEMWIYVTHICAFFFMWSKTPHCTFLGIVVVGSLRYSSLTSLLNFLSGS